MKRGYVHVWGTCKNLLVLHVSFLKSEIIQANKCPGYPISHELLHIKLFFKKAGIQKEALN